MKLVRFGEPGEERPGVWLGGADARAPADILDVRAMAFDIRDYDTRFFRHGGLERVRSLLRERNRRTVPSDDVRLGPPVARPGKILCLGKNYAEHAAEFGSEVPSRPVVFAKAPTSVTGPFDPIRLAPASRVVDGEVELAFVIARSARRLAAADAAAAVAGYLILNDVTDREAQREGQQWFYGKGFDTFCPLGPFLVTPDELPEPHNARLFSRINGAPLQEGRTSDMVFRIPAILEYLSAAMTLEPGDVIATGTPSGIGSARKPAVLLKQGDLLETGGEGLGTQANPVVRDA